MILTFNILANSNGLTGRSIMTLDQTYVFDSTNKVALVDEVIKTKQGKSFKGADLLDYVLDESSIDADTMYTIAVEMDALKIANPIASLLPIHDKTYSIVGFVLDNSNPHLEMKVNANGRSGRDYGVRLVDGRVLIQSGINGELLTNSHELNDQVVNLHTITTNSLYGINVHALPMNHGIVIFNHDDGDFSVSINQ